MPGWLRQSTAVTVIIGPFIDDTDFKTAETALSITYTAVTLSKNGGAYDTKNDTSTATHAVFGEYRVTFNATDTNTAGILRVTISMTPGALIVWDSFMVLPSWIYDALVAGTGFIPANVEYWNASAVATPDTAGYPKVTIKDGSGQGEILTDNGTIAIVQSLSLTGLASINAEVDTALADYDGPTHAELISEIDTVQSDIFALNTGITTIDTNVDAIKAKTDNLPSDPADQSIIIDATTGIMARLGLPAGASVSADIAGIKSDTVSIKIKTDALPTDPADASDIAASFGTVNTNIAAVKADTAATLTAVDTEVGAIKVVTDKLDTTLVVDGPVWQFTANALELAPSGGGGGGDPWATPLPGAYGAGTAGKIVGDNVNATISSRATQTSVDTVDTVVDAIKLKTDALPSDPADQSLLTADIAAVKSDTVAILTAVDTEVAAIKAKTDNLPTDPADASVIAAAFAVTDANVAAVKADTAAIKAKTDALPSDPADQSLLTADIAAVKADTATIKTAVDTEVAAILAAVDTEVAAIKAKTDNLPSDPADQSILTAQINALNDISMAEVKTQVVNALTVDTYGEPPQGTPPSVLSLAARWQYLFKGWRNKKTQNKTTGVQEIYNAAGAVVDQKRTITDDGTTASITGVTSGP